MGGRREEGGGRREVSIISHRPVTRSDLKHERSLLRGSVNIFATGCSFQSISPGLGVFQGQSNSPSLIIISLITIPREKYYIMLRL